MTTSRPSTANEQLSSFEELKSTVVKSLETSGLLSQIRAQLRANVFKAIESSQGVSGTQAKELSDRSPFTLLSMELVAEFFQFHGLHHSLSVSLCEAQLTTSCTEAPTSLRRRSELIAEMDLEHSEAENCSVLEHLVEARRVDVPHRSVSEPEKEEPKVQVQAPTQKELAPPKKHRSDTWATPASHSREGERRAERLHRRLSDPLGGTDALQSLSQQMAPGSLTSPVGLTAWGPGRGRDIGMLTTSPLGQRQRLPPLSGESAPSMAPPARLTAVLAPSSPNLSPANSSVGTVKEGASLEPSDASASGVSTVLPHASPATSPGDSAGTLSSQQYDYLDGVSA